MARTGESITFTMEQLEEAIPRVLQATLILAGREIGRTQAAGKTGKHKGRQPEAANPATVDPGAPAPKKRGRPSTKNA